MKSTVNISRGQARFRAIVKSARQGGIVTIKSRKKPVAVVVGHEWLTSMIETMEIMSNPEAMQAIRDAEQGKTKYYRLEDIPE